ncbi:DNA polymerase III, epsilon subunit (plasmid) [Euzebya pacifica]|uniref:DNA polymerase III, epsilon subunit n=1 Tax=Euzebya pacifica TaxID=1608957 RepID=A0A346Y720_9ACTN|nr:DNA polymerase III, epsilon subunit [Euzebya pacifica]
MTDLTLLDPATPLSQVEFAVIDVETNDFTPDGNDERQGEIVQVGVAIATTSGIIDRWASNIRPLSGDPGRTDIHGLTADDLKDAPTFAEVHHQLLALFDGRPIVGHGLIRFDAWWVRSELRRLGYVTRKGVVGIDTLDFARGAPVAYHSNRLGPLCEHYGISLDGWHSADVDAEATAGLLPHLFDAHSIQVVGDLTGRYKKARGPVSWLAAD